MGDRPKERIPATATALAVLCTASGSALIGAARLWIPGILLAVGGFAVFGLATSRWARRAHAQFGVGQWDPEYPAWTIKLARGWILLGASVFLLMLSTLIGFVVAEVVP